MPVTYSFKTPVLIGSYPNQVSVGSVRVSSIAFSFQGTTPTSASLQLTLQDPTSGAQFVALQFSDAASLALIRAMLAAINPATGHSFETDLLNKAAVATDPVSGKALIPPGTMA